MEFELLLFLIIAGFVASFIDSVVGGGGLISVPALMLTGLPPTVVLGTNKLAGTMSSLTSSISFLFSGKINVKMVSKLFPLSFVGSVLGKVNYLYGLPMGISMIAGALVGSQVAIRKGSAYVKPLFIGVTVLLIGKQLWGMLI
jgi:uncharacterized membrane protein YfcA